VQLADQRRQRRADRRHGRQAPILDQRVQILRHRLHRVGGGQIRPRAEWIFAGQTQERADLPQPLRYRDPIHAHFNPPI
jgi:hypothetical protein